MVIVSQKEFDELLDKANSAMKNGAQKIDELNKQITCLTHQNIDLINKSKELQNEIQTLKKQIKEYEQRNVIEKKLQELATRLNNGEEIDWKDTDQEKYGIHYSYVDSEMYQTRDCFIKKQGMIYCLDNQFLRKAKQEIGTHNLETLLDPEGGISQ